MISKLHQLTCTPGILLFLALVFSHCSKPDEKVKNQPYLEQEKVVIIVIDGPRYSETFGDPTRKYIPNLDRLSKQGTLGLNFKNSGITFTNPGHVAICTGVNDNLSNDGKELPNFHSIFQTFLKETKLPKSKAWIVTSKDKLEILANCKDLAWKDQFTPSTDCGFAGNGTGTRHDSITTNRAKEIMTEHQPTLLLVNIIGPDISGHSNNWNWYLSTLSSTDKYVNTLWEHTQTNPFYSDQTSFIVTSDHGRHLDSIADGFISHGDGCAGCRHIQFVGFGPAFRANYEVNEEADQRVIPEIVANILGLESWNDITGKKNHFLVQD